MSSVIRELQSLAFLGIANVSWFCLLTSTKLPSVIGFWWAGTPGIVSPVGTNFVLTATDVYDPWSLQLDNFGNPPPNNAKRWKSIKLQFSHDRVKVSTARECGPGCHETYLSSCLFICHAKISISRKNFLVRSG